MRTYYSGPDAVVTSEIFVWRTVPAREFAIRELHEVGITSTAITAGWRTRRRLWELHATYHGGAVVIYSSTSDRVFHQVARALRRAFEELRPHGTWTG